LWKQILPNFTPLKQGPKHCTFYTVSFLILNGLHQQQQQQEQEQEEQHQQPQEQQQEPRSDLLQEPLSVFCQEQEQHPS